SLRPPLSLQCSAPHPPLHSFPTRRSSDLLLGAIAEDAAARGLRLEVAFLGSYELVRQAQQRQLDLAVGFTPLPPHRGVASLSLRSEEHTSELQSRENLVCRLLLEKKNTHR